MTSAKNELVSLKNEHSLHPKLALSKTILLITIYRIKYFLEYNLMRIPQMKAPIQPNSSVVPRN